MMKKYIVLFHSILLLGACSTLSHIPEDETFYTGIRDVAYDRPYKQDKRKPSDSTGVIVALADAYTSVEDLLTGRAAAQAESQSRQRDSLFKANPLDAEAYAMAKEEVEGVLSFPPNGSLMGSSSARWPVMPRLAVYNRYVNSTSRFGKWMLNNVASSPIYISTVNPQLRTQVARTTLKNLGYFNASVAYRVDKDKKDPRQASVSYQVVPGPLYHLDHIEFKHFPGHADSLMAKNRHKSVLASGIPFSARTLDAERTRLSNLLRNNGYYYFAPEYIAFRADTLQKPLQVQLQVSPSARMPRYALRPYHMGKTHITLLQYDNRQISDTVSFRDVTMRFAGKPGRPPLRTGVIRRYMFYRKGDLYNQDLLQAGKDKLTELGIFSQVQVNYIPRDSTGVSDTLDVEVLAILDKPYDSEFEGKVTSKSNGQVGPGLRFAMTKSNVFRGADVLGVEADGSYEWQTGADLHGSRSLINSYEYGLGANLTFPRILLGALGKKLSRRALSSTQFQLNARWLNRANYFGRVSFSFKMNYAYQKKRHVKHAFTPVRLDYDMQLHTTARFDSIMNANQALYVSMRDQFVPSMEYTYTWASLHHAPRTVTVNIKEAGNVTSLIYQALGKNLTDRDKRLFSVPFAQYLKASAQYTHLFRLTPRSGIATRIFGGAILCYGNSRTAPYNDLFNVGGANSIRAFAVRSIGPGRYHPAKSEYSYIDQNGDLKLEANVEYRFPIVGNLYGAAFLDAGNVWLMRKEESRPEGHFKLSRLGRDLALGTGVGLRYDLDFIVVRFDLGIGLHAPYETGHSGYYNMPKFGKTLGYHLAVGYPF